MRSFNHSKLTILFAVFTSSLAIQPPLSAHEEGAPFSDSIIDPLLLHHAHIENEQRINLFAFRGFESGSPGRRSAFEGELEMGYSNHDFTYGFEFFVPFARLPDASGKQQIGIGDIEVRPIKYALVNSENLIVAIATGVGLPTGDKSRGLGSGETVLTQYLFVDKAIGNWFVGLNLDYAQTVAGGSGGEFGYGTVLAYSFISTRQKPGTPRAKDAQRWVVSPSIEFLGSLQTRGESRGTNQASVLPGFTVWDTRTGWQVHAGVQLSVNGAREAEQIFLLQFGNHFNWGKMFGAR